MKMSFFKVLFVVILLGFSSVSYAQVNIQTWQTSQGVKVLYVQAEQLPMVDIIMSFDAGSARDGDYWGLASFTASLLGTATAKMNEEEISAAFNNVGSQFSARAGRDRTTISLRSLTRPEILQQSLKVMSEVISQPVFKEAIFDREKNRLQVSLRHSQSSPKVLASQEMWRTLYGDHPYAHPVSGTLSSVDKFTPAKVKSFYKQHFVASNAQIAIVGDVDLKQAKGIAEKLISGLAKGQKPASLPVPESLAKAKTSIIQFDSTQTHYSLSQLGTSRGAEDYVALFVGNHLLGGGGFSSLLMNQVRKERGLVYGIRSYFVPMKVNGPFVIGLSTKNASVAEADNLVREILTAFIEDFSDEKFELIKDNLIGGFPLRMDNNRKIVRYISMMGFYDLRLDYLEWFPEQIAALTKQDVLTAWQKHINPNKMLMVKVGDLESLEAP